jgi:hypothetical protein
MVLVDFGAAGGEGLGTPVPDEGLPTVHVVVEDVPLRARSAFTKG